MVVMVLRLILSCCSCLLVFFLILVVNMHFLVAYKKGSISTNFSFSPLQQCFLDQFLPAISSLQAVCCLFPLTPTLSLRQHFWVSSDYAFAHLAQTLQFFQDNTLFLYLLNCFCLLLTRDDISNDASSRTRW